MTQETTTIPLNKLVLWDGNVRRTGAGDGIGELAASIAAHGLLQSLVVRKAPRGKYAVVAGGRRLAALQSLAKAKTITTDTPVACRVVDQEVDAGELSLAENVVRLAMHPADQFEAFRKLIDDGARIADVAARFGVSETLILKRLKLGRVSPLILAAYRDGEIGLELVQAFALTDDTEAQERLWNDLPAWNLHPRTVKQALTEGEVPASDKRVRLVGLDTYKSAGGMIWRDLFDPNDGGYVVNAELLDRLVTEKLEAAAAELRSEGWKWVEIVLECDYGFLSGFDRRYPEQVPLSDEDQAELDRLTAEYDELVDTDDEAQIARLDEIDRRIDELSDGETFWPAETLAIAGAIVTIGYQGDIRIERGLVRPEDRPAAKRSEASSGDADGSVIKLPAKLTEDLTAQKTAALGDALAQRPDIALAATVHALALRVYYGSCSRSCLQVTTAVTGIERYIAAPNEAAGLTAVTAQRQHWAEQLPGNLGDLWDWCLAQNQETLLDLLAVIAAVSLDAVQLKVMHPGDASLRHADALASALSLDMGEYFTPTAENFFSRINGASIQAAICEAKSSSPAPSWAKMKKAELAALAERQVAGTGWLPAPLRMADGSIADDADETDDSDESDVHALAEAAE